MKSSGCREAATYCSFANAVRHVHEVLQSASGADVDDEATLVLHHHTSSVHSAEVVVPQADFVHLIPQLGRAFVEFPASILQDCLNDTMQVKESAEKQESVSL